MKCMPMTLSGRLVEEASFVIGMDEVLDASMASGLSNSSNCLNRSSFRPSFSLTASITRSDDARSSATVEVMILDRVASTVSVSM
jgi:hypothetical protein